MSAVPGRMNGDDAPLAQALDSFDQLTLCRDRQRRRVTEEENAVRGLEELLTEKQREAEQLAREADSRAAELAALERRVPGLEETCRGARRSLQMLTQMRDLLSQQLNTEKRRTEEMLKTLDGQMEEAAARWNQYEAVYLTMPAFQQKIERDALAAEERELNERKQQLEAELKSRVSDRDFCVRLAECWTQARLLEGAIAGGDSGGGGGQSPDRENMSSACSQGFGTPRASHSPSPVSDMETSQDPDGGESQPEAASGPAGDVARTAITAGSPAGRGQRPPEGPPPPLVAGRSGDQERQPPGGVGVPAGQCCPNTACGLPAAGRAGIAPAEAGPSTPQKRPPPPSSWREATSPQTPSQGGARLQTPLQARSGLQSPFQIGVTPQQDQPSPQSQLQSRERPQPSLQNTEYQQSPAQNRSPSQTWAGPPSQTAPPPEKAGWSPTGPREPAASPRRPASFLIQMPSLYRPSRARADGSAETQVSHRPAAPVPPPVSAPSQYRSPQPPLPPPYQQQQRQQQPPATTQAVTATTQDVEMMDVRENQQSPVRQPPGGQPRGAGAGSSPSRSGMQTSQQDRSAGGLSPSRQPTAAEGRQTQPQTTEQHQPAVPAAAAAEQGTPRTVAGRQYWLPMPPETPPAPPMDERRSFVQQLRQSPELSRRPPPFARPAAPPLESGLEHQFMRPAVPPPRRPAPVPAAGSPQSIFDTPRRPPVEPASPQRPPVSSLSREPPSTPRPPAPAAPSEPVTPVRPVAAAGDAPRSMAAIFASPEADVDQLDSSFSLFGGSAGKEASPQPPQPSSMSLFGAGDVGGDGDQRGDDFSFSFFGGGARGAEKEASGGGGGGGVFSFF